MHIILAFLGTIVTILVLLNRLGDAGIDIGWLNPFTWRRRREWRKKFEGSPVFALESPLDVAAMLATSVAKIGGEISREEKSKILSLFQSEFNRTEQEATDLLMSSIYLFSDGEQALSKPERVMKRSLESFSEEQAQSVIALLNEVKEIDNNNLVAKEQFISKVVAEFETAFGGKGQW